MKNDFEKLRSLIDDKVVGIVWNTNEKLIEQPAPFHLLDYFFDGILTNFCANCVVDNKIIRNLFVAPNFGHNIFLLHLENLTSEIDAHIEHIVDLSNNFYDKDKNRNKILIISEKIAPLIAKSISTKLPNIQTENIFKD